MKPETDVLATALTPEELAKREGLKARKPHVAAKLAKIGRAFSRQRHRGSALRRGQARRVPRGLPVKAVGGIKGRLCGMLGATPTIIEEDGAAILQQTLNEQERELRTRRAKLHKLRTHTGEELGVGDAKLMMSGVTGKVRFTARDERTGLCMATHRGCRTRHAASRRPM